MIDRNKLMRSVFLALALLFVAPLAGIGGSLIGVEAAQAQTVSRITVSGNSRVDTGTVISYLAVKVGEPASPAKISQSIDALYKTGLFKTVNVSQSGGTVLVRISENPIVGSVLFQGNQRFSDKELLTMVQVAARGSYTPDRVQTDIASIKQAYVGAGYTNVSVTAKTEAADGGRTRVVFVINEGTRSGIAAINFTGNNAIPTSTLKSVILTKETGFLSWLLRDDTYDPQKVEVDKQLIRNYYANHGYPDAQVSSAVAEFDAKRNGYFINFTINEGDRYAFGTMGVETSIAGLNADQLKGSIKTDTGTSYSVDDLQKTASNMAFKATGQGYPFADVRPRIDRDPSTHKINITYLVDQGPRAYVERINITGNAKTRDFVIRRELDFSEGDAFNQAIVARGKTAIMALGFFKTVDITTEPGSAPDKVVVDVAVVEQSTGDYGVSAGYSTQDGILGEVSITERNFLGRGQYVRAAIGATGTGKTFDFSFTEPRFMGLKVSSGIDLYHRIYDQSFTNYYGVTTTGGQIRFGLPITDALSGNVFIGGEQKSIQMALNDGATPPNLYPQSQLYTDGQTFNKIFGGYGLSYNTLDDQKNPTSGILATFTQQYAGWDVSYLRSEAKARYFMPLLGSESGIVGSVRGQAGIINDLSGKGIYSIDAFQPGASLVRGFESQTLGGHLTPAVGSTINGEYLGATEYAGLSAEVQFPIPVLPASYGLSGAVWADGAVVSGLPYTSTASVDPNSTDNPFKASVGASVIWNSPFGPLRGDFGYVLSKATSDKTQLFQLTLQTLL